MFMSHASPRYGFFCLVLAIWLAGCAGHTQGTQARTALDVTRMADNKIGVAILTESTRTLSLYVGEKRWGSGPVEAGEDTLATLEVSDRLQLDDGSFGHGMIFTRSNGRGFARQFLAVTEDGLLPYGKVRLRNADAVVRAADSVIIADIEEPDGTSVSVCQLLG